MQTFLLVAAIAGPYLAYIIGVILADKLCLYPTLTKQQIYLKAIPVGLVAVSTMLMGVTVSVPGTAGGDVKVYYGHTESVPEYLLFLGTIMFIGTLVPDMFSILRARLTRAT